MRSSLSSLVVAVAISACVAETQSPTVFDDASTGAAPDATGGADATTMVELDAGSRFHAQGYVAPAVHGLELKTGALDCRNCHGMDLTGTVIGPSCDSCHQQGWRASCTYCHGGTLSQNGAPPRDLRGETDPALITFRPHQPHTTLGNHAAWDCDQCHAKPADVLSAGHVFDSTPGAPEVDFSSGLSPNASYAAGTCSSLYCHGNGQATLGTIAQTAPTPACDGCHPSISTPTRWLSMSGEHRRHLRENITCGECHGATVNVAGTAITGPEMHVNGMKDLVFSVAGFSRTNGTCTGVCHTERHTAERW